MPDIEVTDEMIKAGNAEVRHWLEPIEEVPVGFAAALFRAMRAKERETPRRSDFAPGEAGDADYVRWLGNVHA